MAEGLNTPEELRRIADEQKMAKAREALEKKRKGDDERQKDQDDRSSGATKKPPRALRSRPGGPGD